VSSPIANRRAKVLHLPADPKARDERRLAALWSKEDDLTRQLTEIQKAKRSLQRDVSLGRGYLFTVSREVLERAGVGR